MHCFADLFFKFLLLLLLECTDVQLLHLKLCVGLWNALLRVPTAVKYTSSAYKLKHCVQINREGDFLAIPI